MIGKKRPYHWQSLSVPSMYGTEVGVSCGSGIVWTEMVERGYNFSDRLALALMRAEDHAVTLNAQHKALMTWS